MVKEHALENIFCLFFFFFFLYSLISMMEAFTKLQLKKKMCQVFKQNRVLYVSDVSAWSFKLYKGRGSTFIARLKINHTLQTVNK